MRITRRASREHLVLGAARASLRALLLTAASGFLLTAIGCVSTKIPAAALQLSTESLHARQLQTRKYDTQDERKLLVAAAGLLQDMGYSIEESETSLGVIVASKERDATEGGQVVGSVLMAALFGADVPYDSEQQIRACIVTRPSGATQSQMLLRVTFQRLVWNNKGVLWKREPIDEADVYGEFFEKLSKAVFLEAQEL